jgi:hypothetical protein
MARRIASIVLEACPYAIPFVRPILVGLRQPQRLMAFRLMSSQITSQIRLVFRCDVKQFPDDD